jgi:hypothetical protein
VIFASTVNGEKLAYRHRQDVLSPGAVVTMRFRMRVVSNATAGPSRAGAMVIWAFGPERKKNMLGIENGKVFLCSAENTRGPEATVATSDAMHDYEIVVDMGAETVTVFHDQMNVLSASLFVTATDTTTDYLSWGDGSTVASGESHWESFSHDAYGACD